MSARVKLPPELADLLRSELETAIREAALHRDDELIARRYIVEKWAQMDIAVEVGQIDSVPPSGVHNRGSETGGGKIEYEKRGQLDAGPFL